MASMTTSGPGEGNDAATQRERHLGLLDIEIAGVAADPTALIRASEHALTAARWAVKTDEQDRRVVALLRLTAELTNAAAVSSASTEPGQQEIRGALVVLPPGLARDGLTTRRWIDGLWAATAAGDASTARRLARLDLSVYRQDTVPGEFEMTQAMAAWWRSEEIGPFLIAALERSDPDSLAPDDIDFSLDVIAPTVAFFRRLADRDDAALNQSLIEASAAFAEYWSRAGANDPCSALSLPLSGLSRVAVELGRVIRAIPGAVPPAILESSGPVLCCPVCDQPFGDAEISCSWCGTDLTVDAPLEVSLDQLLEDPGQSCPHCGQTCPRTALRCWNCGTTLF